MARFVYAKIYCDILRHPLLRDRPDCDVRLVVGLLLEAKEHTADGVLRRMTAESARGLCHIKAPARKVQEGIDYLVAEGWLIPHPDQAYEIKDFVQRQAADSAAERMSRSRDKRRDDSVTKRNGAVTPNVTVASPEVEGEGEKEEEEKKQKALSANSPTAGGNRDAERVFEEWRRVMGKNAGAQFTPERERKVRARLKDGYSVERLFKAIRGCKISPHHSGQNESGTVYDDLELICRDGKHVETFEGFCDKPQPLRAPVNGHGRRANEPVQADTQSDHAADAARKAAP